jgi:3-mercaptopyruvate sulfurtransferase SseA
LVEHGIPTKEMNVGWAEWKEAGLPTETGATPVGERQLRG